MTASLGLQFGRRAPAPTKDELRRQLLALVLALVLVWYTFVVPASASAGSYARAAPDDEGLDGEVRGVGGASRSEEKVKKESVEEKVKKEKAATGAANELDWPEYIYP